jgi:hypothetical protein
MGRQQNFLVTNIAAVMGYRRRKKSIENLEQIFAKVIEPRGVRKQLLFLYLSAAK